MSILELKGSVDLEEPVLVIAVSGWVDGGSVATTVGNRLAPLGHIGAAFRPDEIYDYGAHRPTVDFSDGSSSQIRWPSLSVTAISEGRRDLLVLTGVEPDARWQQISAELAELASSAGVIEVVAVGAVVAAVSHTRETPIMITSTDPTIDPVGIPTTRFSVPASFVNVAAHQVAASNQIPDVGFWAQIPHYVSGVYWPAVEAMMTRLSLFLGIETDLGDLHVQAEAMIDRLNQVVASRPEARKLIQSLEEGTPDFGLDEASNIAEEIESFLRQIDDDENPFG